MDEAFRPLADRLRPRMLDEYIGQSHLIAPRKPLYEAIKAGRLHSMILWGPPGTGKTTLARLIAHHADAHFLTLSAVLSGVKEIREAVAEARRVQAEEQRRSLLFVDEVHRFNKSQQDAFLPHVEDGTVFFIGATTENPSFELNNALLSRARVYVLKGLSEDDLGKVAARALALEAERLGVDMDFPSELRRWYVDAADGDARRLLNLLEITLDLLQAEQATVDAGSRLSVSEELARQVLEGGSARRFDKQGEDFYNQISALHKSVRGSAPDAALYWLCRMLDGGCDPIYLARRIVRIASEDIGNADPRALQLALNAWDTQERLGSPEGELALAQAVLYLACAPKSNAVYAAYNAARQDASTTGSLEVPLHLRNAPTRLMRELDYGKAYRYAHDEPEAYAAGENYFPDRMQARNYYQPAPRGLEIKIGEKLNRLRELDKAQN
ncbi:replication-associated recombination protein A [Methyloterricola oryzae]|uniref:replication-associated recombination protein A n=1 Tax=Methyloterricola oryzae TaxID=1495050 RepID=UPI0005EBDE1A|nr:replication-associated recombination protein A [Methyloterricola oryzae]